MVSIFGDVVDVSNLIITGLYSSKDTFPQVFEIVNNKPYKPSISDEKIIRDGITEWLFRIYPYRVYSLDSSFYKSVKYTSSQLGFFDNIQDNYSIKILPFKEMDSILIEFDFPRFTIPSEYLKKDEIRIHN
jgi:hypothetical protein